MKYLLAGAPIYTLDERYGVAQAMVVEDGWIVAVGDLKLLHDAYPTAKALDIDGAAVIPAFNDSHAHLFLLGQDLTRCNLGECRTKDQVLDALQHWMDNNVSEPWVMGWNFDAANFQASSPLYCKDLDEVSCVKPVMISDKSKHALLANSVAMKVAGITRSTPSPHGGIIERDPTGQPMGVFREMAAMALIESAMPDPGQEGVVKSLHAAMEYLEKKGILAATEAFAGNWYPLTGKIAAYNRILKEGSPVRITLMPEFIAAKQLGWLESKSIHELNLHKDLRLGPLKLMADGAISARTAALFNPYENSTAQGNLALEKDELKHRLLQAHQAGWATATHAIGDLAIQITLEAIENAQFTHPNVGLHHRIEHAILLNKILIDRLAAANIMIAAQPQLLLEMGDNHYAAVGERCFNEKPYRSLLNAHIELGFGSDLPVVDGDPILGWRAAVTRQTRSGMEIGPGEALSPLAALKCYTSGSAAVGGDCELGTLIPEKQARFAVLSHRPEMIVEEDLRVIGVSSQIMVNNKNFN